MKAPRRQTARLFPAVLIALLGACDGGGSGGSSPAGAIQFSSAGYSVGEGGGMATMTARRVRGTGAAGVFVTLAPGGTATAGQDYPQYVDYVASLQWADGDAADKTFTIPITDDALPEPDETVNLSLALPTGGASLGTPSAAVLTIVDNDSAPTAGTLQFSSAAFSVGEGAGEVTVTVTRRGGSSGAVGVFATFGPGGTATPGRDYPQYID